MRKIGIVVVLTVALGMSVAHSQSRLSSSSAAASQRLQVPTQTTLLMGGDDFAANEASVIAAKAEEHVREQAHIDQLKQDSRNQAASEAHEIQTTATEALLTNVAAGFSEILSGNAKTYAVALTENSHSLIDQNRVEVSVHYDPRPVGGILNVSVSLRPVFSGIGITNRAVATTSQAQAIDNLTTDALNTIITDLSQKLAKQIEPQKDNAKI